MFDWANNNQGLMSAILSIMGVIVSVIAICISINVSRKQNRIALFDKKFEIYKALEEYFNSSKGWPKAVNKFLIPSSSLPSDNAWAPEINEIVGKATLLFSERLNGKLQEIKNKYAEIRHLDGRISLYFSLLQELPDYQDIKPLFIEYLKSDCPSGDEEKKFEELCNRLTISTNEPIGDGKYELVNYKFYDLYRKQSDLVMEIAKAKNNILEIIISEIKPI